MDVYVSTVTDAREMPHWCECRWKYLRPSKSHNKLVCHKSDTDVSC